MKNSTGSDLLWKGVIYPQGEDVPEAIAKEMGLSIKLNKQSSDPSNDQSK